MGAHVVRTFDEHHVLARGVAGPRAWAEEDEHGRLATTLVGGQEAREALGVDSRHPLGEVAQPCRAGGASRSRRGRVRSSRGCRSTRWGAPAHSLRGQLVLQQLRAPRRGRSRRCRSTGTAGRAGRRRRRASWRGRCAGRGRSRRGDSIVQSRRGNRAPTSCSTLTGSVSSVQPKRRTSRPKWVSTVMPGTLKALPSTTFAVLRPTPGRVTRSLERAGHLAVEALDQRRAEA